MKCPYQTKVIHKTERTVGYAKDYAEDITTFCECVKDECPFYYTMEYCTKGHCRRAEREG